MTPKAVKDVREALNFTQSQMAELLFFFFLQYCRMERGHIEFPARQQILAFTFGKAIRKNPNLVHEIASLLRGRAVFVQILYYMLHVALGDTVIYDDPSKASDEAPETEPAAATG